MTTFDNDNNIITINDDLTLAEKQLPGFIELENTKNLKQEKKIKYVDIKHIKPDPNQPRKFFDEPKLLELAESIKQFGIIQPIVVRKRDSLFIIIAGERRYRASLLAGLAEMPVIIENLTDKEVREISIIENLQRENLNPIEEARALKALIEEFSLTQEEVATRLSKSRPAITNALRLLNLSLNVQEKIARNMLSPGHGRCLIILKNKEIQIRFAEHCIKEKWSVRQLEKSIDNYLNPTKPKQLKLKLSNNELGELVDDMQRVFATRVQLLGNAEKGRIYIDYYSKEDIIRIMEIIEEMKNLMKTAMS